MIKKSHLDLTVIIVSYNTKNLTLKCLETLYKNTKRTSFRTVVYDNASADGSADAIEQQFPHVELIRSTENLGFAKANNIVAQIAVTEWLLLLNPDTEVHINAIDNLLDFSIEHPGAGITGGRTVFPDGSLNVASCWGKITLWSTFCHAIGLSTIFPKTNVFNPEALGSWPRDTVRHVDIVSGCFFMLKSDLWKQLNGFNLKYIMYGEDADLCLRAKALGYMPMITPNAQIMHLVGASSHNKSSKTLLVSKARATLIRDHWPRLITPIGIFNMLLWCRLRLAYFQLIVPLLKNNDSEQYRLWQTVWSDRRNWIKGYF